MSVARVSVQRLEVSRGGKSKGAGAAKGALWGAIIAGAAGAVLAALQHDEIGETDRASAKPRRSARGQADCSED